MPDLVFPPNKRSLYWPELTFGPINLWSMPLLAADYSGDIMPRLGAVYEDLSDDTISEWRDCSGGATLSD